MFPGLLSPVGVFLPIGGAAIVPAETRCESRARPYPSPLPIRESKFTIIFINVREPCDDLSMFQQARLRVLYKPCGRSKVTNYVETALHDPITAFEVSWRLCLASRDAIMSTRGTAPHRVESAPPIAYTRRRRCPLQSSLRSPRRCRYSQPPNPVP